MMKKSNSSLIDTDIIHKIGGYRKEDLLNKVLIDLGYNLYIHEYVIDEELLCGENSLRQLNEMITEEQIVIIKESDLTNEEKFNYNTALTLLAKEMNVDLSKKRDKNAGEVKSMAIAYAKDFNYFISDDKDARVAAKKILQNTDGSYLNTIRLKDIIIHIRNNSERLNIDRKTAKRLYLYGINPKLGRNTEEIKKLTSIFEILKKDFDSNLWPV